MAGSDFENVNSSIKNAHDDASKLHKTHEFRLFNQLAIAKKTANKFLEQLDQFTITKLQRALLLFSFFIFIVTLIICCSGIYSHVILIKQRRKRYGFFVHARYEAAVYQFIFKINTKLFFIVEIIKMLKKKIVTLSAQSQKKTADYLSRHRATRNVEKFHFDTSYDNQVFDSSNDSMSVVLLNEDDTGLTNDDRHDNNKSKPISYISKCLEEKRINSFKYEKIKDCQQRDILLINKQKRFSATEIHNVSSDIKKSGLLTVIENKLRSFPNISDIFVFRFYNNKRIKTSDSIVTNMTEVGIELPLILITDTSKMTTKVIDLETFQPENYQC